MADPIVTWYDEANALNLSEWALGTVDAGGDPSLTQKNFLIWNNRGGATGVAKMTNCTITTKDTDGNMTIPLVREAWVQAKVVSMGEGAYSPIGAEFISGAWRGLERPMKASGSTAGSQEILGIANNGNKADASAQNCFAEVSMRVAVPTTAVAGAVNFLVRCFYEHA
jgi:hypothetical protein